MKFNLINFGFDFQLPITDQQLLNLTKKFLHKLAVPAAWPFLSTTDIIHAARAECLTKLVLYSSHTARITLIKPENAF